MRRARAGPGHGQVLLGVGRGRRCLIWNNGPARIPEPEALPLAVQVLHLLLEGRGDRALIAREHGLHRGGPTPEVGHTEVRVGLRNRPALLAIGLEQAWTSPSVQHGRQLPRQVVRILDAGIRPEATRGWQAVSRIARQKHTAVLEALSHLCRERPECKIDYFDGQVGDAHGLAHELAAALWREVIRALTVGGSELTHKQPPVGSMRPGFRDWKAVRSSQSPPFLNPRDSAKATL